MSLMTTTTAGRSGIGADANATASAHGIEVEQRSLTRAVVVQVGDIPVIRLGCIISIVVGLRELLPSFALPSSR